MIRCIPNGTPYPYYCADLCAAAVGLGGPGTQTPRGLNAVKIVPAPGSSGAATTRYERS
jgi:hypothetical protein